jgi:hypothetical protein
MRRAVAGTLIRLAHKIHPPQVAVFGEVYNGAGKQAAEEFADGLAAHWHQQPWWAGQ